MEIKNILNSPFTEEDRYNFIIDNNYELGYIIKEYPDKIEAWGYTQEEEEAKRKEDISELSATKRVLVLALEQLGFDYYTDIEPKILENRQAKLEWDLCTEVKRNNPLVNILGSELGLSSQQIDDLFVAIATSPMREE